MGQLYRFGDKNPKGQGMFIACDTGPFANLSISEYTLIKSLEHYFGVKNARCNDGIIYSHSLYRIKDKGKTRLKYKDDIYTFTTNNIFRYITNKTWVPISLCLDCG